MSQLDDDADKYWSECDWERPKSLRWATTAACSLCGEDGLVWSLIKGSYRLTTDDGDVHECDSLAVAKREFQGKDES